MLICAKGRPLVVDSDGGAAAVEEGAGGAAEDVEVCVWGGGRAPLEEAEPAKGGRDGGSEKASPSSLMWWQARGWHVRPPLLP
jgi:hypothetical protein